MARAFPAFNPLPLYDAVLKISTPACFARPGCTVSGPIISQCLGPTGMVGAWGTSGGVEVSWGISAAPCGPWPEGAYMDITCLHGGNEDIGVLARSCVNLQESEGKCVQISVLV